MKQTLKIHCLKARESITVTVLLIKEIFNQVLKKKEKEWNQGSQSLGVTIQVLKSSRF